MCLRVLVADLRPEVTPPARTLGTGQEHSGSLQPDPAIEVVVVELLGDRDEIDKLGWQSEEFRLSTCGEVSRQRPRVRRSPYTTTN